MSHVRYIDKTREYYKAEGYETPYRWAHFDEIPFAPLSKPLSKCRVGLATTSEMAIKGEPDRWARDAATRDVYALPMNTPVERLCSRKDAYDRYATTLDDIDAQLPLTRLREAVEAGRIGSLAARFQVIHSEYSHRKTMEADAPEILRQMTDDRVDVAVLTAI